MSTTGKDGRKHGVDEGVRIGSMAPGKGGDDGAPHREAITRLTIMRAQVTSLLDGVLFLRDGGRDLR